MPRHTEPGRRQAGQVARTLVHVEHALARVATEVVVGSGLPPSAHTRRSTINLSGLGDWYQYTGVTMMMPCAAVQRS